ncbi:MAG TPA: MFS transporter [Chthonomonadaceae bacterium]|nr:MFS transporter [Chthonomonadaceae bacterium]
MTAASIEGSDPKLVKRNLFALLVDVISYWVGAAFTDPMTVLQILLVRLGATPAIIGGSIALRFALQYGVMVFVAYVVHGKPKQKPFLVWAVGLSRLPMVALPFVIYHSDTVGGKTIALWVTIGVLAFVGLGEGLGGVPWTEIVARAFDSKTRGRFFACAQIAAGVLNILIAWQIVTKILGLSYPLNFTMLIGLSALMFQISTLGLLLIMEPPDHASRPASPPRPPLREYLAELPKMISADKTFARLVLIQILVNSGWAALPYYAPFALSRFHLHENWGGTFQLLQAISVALLMPVWVFLSEHRTPAAAVRGVALACTITPIIAITIGLRNPYYFSTVYLLTGGTLTAGGIWVVMQHFLLSHTEEDKRPKAIALLNLLNLPSAMFPLLGSALVYTNAAGQMHFVLLFHRPLLWILVAIVSGIGFLCSLRLRLADECPHPMVTAADPMHSHSPAAAASLDANGAFEGVSSTAPPVGALSGEAADSGAPGSSNGTGGNGASPQPADAESHSPAQPGPNRATAPADAERDKA